MAIRECTECGHETDSNLPSCTFCGAPRLHRTALARSGMEALTKWTVLLLVVYGAYHLASQFG